MNYSIVKLKIRRSGKKINSFSSSSSSSSLYICFEIGMFKHNVQITEDEPAGLQLSGGPSGYLGGTK